MKQIHTHAVVLAVCLCVLPGCSGRDEPLMDVHQLMGKGPEQLKERLGPADNEVVETPTRFGFLRWNRLRGVRLLVMVKEGRSVYLTYNFRDMPAFDEAEALAMAGIERPEEEPTLIEQSTAVRWDDYEGYGRLTINPLTKLVSVGRVPVGGGERPAEGEAAAEEHVELDTK